MTAAQPTPNADIAAGVHEIVAKHFKMDVSALRADTKFREDLHADSLDLVLIVHDVEDRFHVVIAQEDLLKVLTVADAVAIVARSPAE